MRVQIRKNNFDALRLCAALFVMVGHMCTLTGRHQPMLGSLSLDRLGVLIFFSISGYLISSSWSSDPHLVRFLQRRFLRIWPGFAAVVLMTFGTAFAAGTVNVSDLGYLGKLMFQNTNVAAFPLNRVSELNGSLWTIPAEVQCYLALCAFGLLTRRLGRWVYAVTFAGWLLIYGVGLVSFDDPPVAYFGSFFMAGACISKFPELLHRNGIAASAVLAASAYPISPYASAACCIPLLTIYIGLQSLPGFRSAGTVGDLSYGVYLWAFPVQQTVILLLGESAPYVLQLFASIAVTLFFAILSWHFVESPALKLKPKPRVPAVDLETDRKGEPPILSSTLREVDVQSR